MAFYCSHMALHLINSDERFEIYGPIIMNSEVMVYEGKLEDVHRVGIAQKRTHLQKVIKENYTQVNAMIEIMPNVLPYSMEEKQIEAAVIDITKASLLSKFKFAPVSKEDYVSYCLVIRKDLIGTEVFERFIQSYNMAVVELNEQGTCTEQMGISTEVLDVANVKFLEL